MESFRSQLEEEIRCYSALLKEIERRRKKPLRGRLEIDTSHACAQYYFRRTGGARVYLRQEKKKLICRLAQQGYEEKLERRVRRSLRLMRVLLEDLKKGGPGQLFDALSPARQALVDPYAFSPAMRLALWRSKEAIGPALSYPKPPIFTNRGEQVRSKSEKILADMFEQEGLPYKYECPLLLGGQWIHPDFTFLNPFTNQEIYWEHDGRMDDPTYLLKALRKIQLYEKQGFFRGQNLIVTYERGDEGLDFRWAHQLMKRFLSFRLPPG